MEQNGNIRVPPKWVNIVDELKKTLFVYLFEQQVNSKHAVWTEQTTMTMLLQYVTLQYVITMLFQ